MVAEAFDRYKTFEPEPWTAEKLMIVDKAVPKPLDINQRNERH